MKLLLAILCELSLIGITQQLNKPTVTPVNVAAGPVIHQHENVKKPMPVKTYKKTKQKKKIIHKQENIIEPKKINFVESVKVFRPKIKITKKDDS